MPQPSFAPRRFTQILNALERGDPQAAAQLLPLVYDELRKLAAQRLAHEGPGHSLEATALVHEAYLRLVGSNGSSWDHRGHFFAAAALLALNEALDRLAEEEPAAAEVVKLRYFAGLTIEQAADALDLSIRTTNRHWAYARAWLFRRLHSGD